ncbi:S66 family peptidase [Mycoplasma phocoenae]|uniref:LD-carboxypeptidase n=1 Tax=Mycoplasma phocoenae TaxID=754517 RepID=A0A858U2T8_9MOLU|nr:S66 peptidase family protein [Mycoplasma phocoenae]QJG66790.1 LD-carboxypeptidase [Mycoplasma phocoenae]
MNFYNLNKGDEIRIIAPSRSLKLIGETNTNIAKKALEELGFKVTFGKNVLNEEKRNSASIEQRVNDLHEAFLDKNVKAILTVIGGFNSNQLLPYIDWEIIKNNPKVFSGFSDITILHTAIAAKTHMPTFYGPHFSSFGMIKNSEYIKREFSKFFLDHSKNIELSSSEYWSDDLWFIDQVNRNIETNEGWWTLQKGQATGVSFGGNLNTLLLLPGTEYWPEINQDTILVIEDVSTVNYDDFDRMLESLTQSSWFKYVKGILIGRFCKNSNITKDDLNSIISSKTKLNNMPIIANLDFGHSMPLSVIPLGMTFNIEANNKTTIKINK